MDCGHQEMHFGMNSSNDNMNTKRNHSYLSGKTIFFIAMDKKGADNVATHTIIIMLLLNVLIVIVGTTNGVIFA